MIDFSFCIEAHITSLALVDGAKDFSIGFKDQARMSFALVAEEVDRLLVSDFREQNIVDRVQLWDSTNDPDDYFEQLRALISGDTCCQASDTWEQLVKKETAHIRRGEKVFFLIEAVYGASVSLLAKSVQIAR